MGLLTGFEKIVRQAEPLAMHTWFQLGGPAEHFAEPRHADELIALVRRCREEEVPVRVLGQGSNLLVRDEGVAGMVVRLSEPAFAPITVEGQTITAGGGAKLGRVVTAAVREGLAGLEFLVAIPGTLGGALHGNAGTHGGDIGQWTCQAVRSSCSATGKAASTSWSSSRPSSSWSRTIPENWPEGSRSSGSSARPASPWATSVPGAYSETHAEPRPGS